MQSFEKDSDLFWRKLNEIEVSKKVMQASCLIEIID